MTAPNGLRAIPVEDRAWLVPALADALAGGAPIFPVAPGTDPEIVAQIQDTPLPAHTAVIVRTSGSSGIPKTVALSADALIASAEATHEAFGGPGQWLVSLPAHLISGLQMLVRSSVSGIAPVFAPGSFEADRFIEAAEQLDAARQYASVVPVQLTRLLDLAEQDADAADALRRFDALLVGGQSVPLSMRQRSHELGISLKRSYGMTETAGGCVYDGVSTGDTRVRIRDGEVQIAGSSLALGYVGDPELTARRFVLEPDRAGTPTRWYRTGDAGELLAGTLHVTGRLDRAIISGGVNVSLDEVERVVHEQRGWEGAVALGTPHAEWGERVSLVVERVKGVQERDPGAPRLRFDEIAELIKGRLGAAAVPVWATEADEIPRLPGGKPDLAALQEWLDRLRASFRETQTAASRPRQPQAAHEPEEQDRV